MNIFTNFEILIYVYLGLTLSTLLYPVELFFRTAFVNLLFMILLSAILVLYKYDLGYLYSSGALDKDLKDIYILLGIGSVWIIILRFTGQYSLLDTLFLGFFPVLAAYTVPSVVFISYFGSIINIGIFLFIYGSFVYNKTIVEAFFAVKFYGDRF